MGYAVANECVLIFNELNSMTNKRILHLLEYDMDYHLRYAADGVN